MRKKEQKRKRIHDDDYIAYIDSGESAAVFVVRDVCKAINSKGFWIDIVDMSAHKNNSGEWIFDYIKCELFPRLTKPDYSNRENVEYITWQTAQKDIATHRSHGKKGIRYDVVPILFNANKGKFQYKKVIWNKVFDCIQPRGIFIESSCEYRTIKKPVTPNWMYSIKSVKRL